MTKIFAGVLAGIGLIAGVDVSGAASFDCAKATSKVEKAICSQQALSDLDEYLGRYYGGAAETLMDGAACLKADQRDWVKTVRDACGAKVDCLKDAYLKRLGTLDNLQPGASQLKNVELPKVPLLITAIPAAADSVAAKLGRPMRVSGKMVYETNDIHNMGYAVKLQDSKPSAFIFEMDIGSSPTHETVQGLFEQTGKAVFEVRGFVSSEGGFDQNQCRYVYLLP